MWLIVVYCMMRCALCFLGVCVCLCAVYTNAFVCVVCEVLYDVLYDDVRVVCLFFVGV